jgi:hypothetical protein
MGVFSSGAKTVKAWIQDADMILRVIPQYLSSLAVVDTSGRQQVNVATGNVTASIAPSQTLSVVTTVGIVNSVAAVATVASFNGINPVYMYMVQSTDAEVNCIRNRFSFS